MESATDQMLMKNKLDLVALQSLSEATGLDAPAAMAPPPQPHIFYAAKRADLLRPSPIAPSSTNTMLAPSAPGQEATRSTGKLPPNQHHRPTRESSRRRAPDKGDGGARSATAATGTSQPQR